MRITFRNKAIHNSHSSSCNPMQQPLVRKDDRSIVPFSNSSSSLSHFFTSWIFKKSWISEPIYKKRGHQEDQHSTGPQQPVNTIYHREFKATSHPFIISAFLAIVLIDGKNDLRQLLDSKPTSLRKRKFLTTIIFYKSCTTHRRKNLNKPFEIYNTKRLICAPYYNICIG